MNCLITNENLHANIWTENLDSINNILREIITYIQNNGMKARQKMSNSFCENSKME